MARRDGTHLSIGIEYPTRNVDGFSVVGCESRTIDLNAMDGTGPQVLQKFIKDHQLLGEILEKHPKEIADIGGRREASSQSAGRFHRKITVLHSNKTEVQRSSAPLDLTRIEKK